MGRGHDKIGYCTVISPLGVGEDPSDGVKDTERLGAGS